MGSPDDRNDRADMSAGRNVSSDVGPNPVTIVASHIRGRYTYNSLGLAEEIVADLRSRGLLPEGQNLSINPSCEPVEGEAERLREAVGEYLLWEPGRRGHAAAHRRLRAVLSPAPEGER